jgi:hypothetical protein
VFEKFLLLQRRNKKRKIMETRKFNNRSEQIEWYAQQRGWEPLTEEDKAALDDAVRMITNLD